MNEIKIKRILKSVPACASWSLLIGLLLLVVLKPLWAAIFLTLYLMYWACRLLYMTALLIIAHLRMYFRKKNQWLDMCEKAATDISFNEILHVVLYPIYQEPETVIEQSLLSLRSVAYPLKSIIVVLAGEERDADTRTKLERIHIKNKKYFRDIITTFHPTNVEGEIPSKGANATYAAHQIKKYLEKNEHPFENVILSCFDVDTCPDKNYFSCLTYHFLINPKRHQTSYQPLPIYSNNIYEVPALARVIEVGSTFWQLVESMRYEKFITFSSHSMSFKTLVDVGYWPVDMISDDSVIFWKCYLYYHGDYRTCPLETPVYMDIAVGKNFFDTIRIQYTQKRRWAWGVENFVYIAMHFLRHQNIPWMVKCKKICQLLENHVNWATWAIIISFITPAIILWGKVTDQNALVLFNLSYINGVLSHALLLILILSIAISKYFMPPRPKHVSRLIYVSFILQWLLLPLISAVLGSLPALDAQTRMMMGKDIAFNRTPKVRVTIVKENKEKRREKK
ncbi:MAG: glycosyltransferase family 2 protein [Candidatus Omnitrophica bacterium]|nr:glycosyltransferase family 2 protein [Candidatus Omnitrophota bacterium]